MPETPERSEDHLRDVVEAIVRDVPGVEIMPTHEFDQMLAAMRDASAEREARDLKAGKRFLDEERDRDVIDGWYAEADRMTLAALPSFLAGLATAYRHDYGTIVHATAAASLAAAHALNGSDTGGITGFQAGCVMWQFIQRWMHMDGYLSLVDYNDLLFPQYEHKFRAISEDVWAHIQAQAREKLAEPQNAHPNVIAHWRRIDAGIVPFGLAIEAA